MSADGAVSAGGAHEPAEPEPEPELEPEPEPESAVRGPGSPARESAPEEPRYEPRYEPGPSAGRLMLVLLVFVVAALAVVAGGVYFT